MSVKLRIESDGTRKGTKLLAEKDGISESVDNLAELEWYFSQEGEFITAWIKVSEVGLTITPDCEKETL